MPESADWLFHHLVVIESLGGGWKSWHNRGWDVVGDCGCKVIFIVVYNGSNSAKQEQWIRNVPFYWIMFSQKRENLCNKWFEIL